MVGVDVLVAVAVGVAVEVAVAVAVAVGGTGVDVAVGLGGTVMVAEGATTTLVTVGGVAVGCTGPQDANRNETTTPTTMQKDFILLPKPVRSTRKITAGL